MHGCVYDIFLYFMLYSFIGWILEVVYAAYKERKFVNRGFLSGPICPVYGFGGLLILGANTVFQPGKVSLLTQVALTILLTTILEYVTGFFMETFLNIKAWDYSNEFCNIQGRICLKFSVLWGILGYVLVYALHPILSSYVNAVNETAKMVAAVMILAYVLLNAANAVFSNPDSVKHLKAFGSMPLNIPEKLFKI